MFRDTNRGNNTERESRGKKESGIARRDRARQRRPRGLRSSLFSAELNYSFGARGGLTAEKNKKSGKESILFVISYNKRKGRIVK